jgi:hypothetical protein
MWRFVFKIVRLSCVGAVWLYVVDLYASFLFVCVRSDSQLTSGFCFRYFLAMLFKSVHQRGDMR